MEIRTYRPLRHLCQSSLLITLAAATLQAVGGCTAPTPFRATNYDIHIHMDPPSNRIEGQTAMRLHRIGDTQTHPRLTVVAFELHPALEVVAVDCDSAVVKAHSNAPKKLKGIEDHPGLTPTIHRITLSKPVDEFTMTVNYAGELYQDTTAGEKRGQIHNFTMFAHIGTNGIYLSEGGYWYPVPVLPDDTAPENTLADYHLVVEQVPGTEFVAGMETTVESGESSAHSWESARPVAGIALTGGRRVRLAARHDGIEIYAVVSPGKTAFGADLIDCAKQCYDRYVPLLGPYPFKEFTVLESFFSSGFAFPGFTQFTPALISPKKMYRRHGFLDHEFVHNWFGNGIYVDPNDGNWCEALTSYCTNLFGYNLDGDTTGARRLRRNKCHFLSRLKPEKDKPLGTFGRKGGPGRGIGYDKGAMVFHMLACKIGQEAFWAGAKRFTTDYMGKFADWENIKESFAAHTDQELDGFFEQWVRCSGSPQLEIRSATHDPAAGVLELVITQGRTDFDLDVPIRIYRDEGDYADVLVSIAAAEQTVRLPTEPAPASVELDPDYHVFRKVPAEQILPTSRLTCYGKGIIIVQPDGDVWGNYALIASDFEKGNKAENTTRVEAAEVTADALRDTGVLILGAAVHQPVVQELLARADCPVLWADSGFEVGGKTFDQPGQAVFVTMHHPDDPKLGITVYYGNDEPALANAPILGHYSNSLLVFGTASHPPGGMGTRAMMGMGGGMKVLHRQDLEARTRVTVTRKYGQTE